MQHCEASHLGMCCLPISSHKRDIRLIWNKQISLHLFLSYFSDVTTEDITLLSQMISQKSKVKRELIKTQVT